MCSKKTTNDDVLKRLAECRAPFLIGVRHHSAALARVMPTLLADFRPKSVLVEMPPEFSPGSSTWAGVIWKRLWPWPRAMRHA